jgi:YD repeat-containing protein
MNQGFAYDALGRLQTVNGPGGTVTMSYDAAGNRTQYVDATGTYSYSFDATTRRLTSLVGPGYNESFAYMATGETSSDGKGMYGIRVTGMLGTVYTPGGGAYVALNDYDTSHARVRRYSFATGVSHYTFRSASGDILSEYDQQGSTWTWTRDNIYVGGRLIGAIKAPTGTIEYYGQDLVNSVRVTFNADGSVFGRQDFYPFGVTLGASGGVPPISLRVRPESRTRRSITSTRGSISREPAGFPASIRCSRRQRWRRRSSGIDMHTL